MLEDPNYIYFNIETYFKGENTFDFDDNRVQSILKNPSDYELAVERFSVPTIGIPIQFKIPNQYKISLEYNGTVKESFVTFPSNSTAPPLYPPYQAIWHYNGFTEGINIALKDIHDQMKLAEPTFLPTKPVYMSYEENTNLFPLYCQSAYTNPTIKLVFNDKLYNVFSSFSAFDRPTPVPKVNEFIILLKDYGNNSTTLGGYDFKIQQQFPTISLLATLRSLVFETNSIPVENELIGSSSKNITRQVITNFLIDQKVQDRSQIQFFPQGPQRWVTLSSRQELRRIDLKVSWSDEFDNLYPIFGDDQNPISMKLVFRKKDQNALQQLQRNDDN